MRSGVVYKLSNGGKNYIGSTTDLASRLSGHESSNNICSSILLYTAGTPVMCSILENVEFEGIEALRIREQHWLDRTENLSLIHI